MEKNSQNSIKVPKAKSKIVGQIENNVKQEIIPVSQSLVIGDVGSGKTAVAFMVGLNYLLGLPGAEVALLAPTEVLAFQHYNNLVEWVERMGLVSNANFDKEAKDKPPSKNEKNILQANSLKNESNYITTVFASAKDIRINNVKVSKKQLDLEIKNYSKIFWVGTHALLFKNSIKPDLVMVDEQHRFGVSQRQSLNSKNKNGSLEEKNLTGKNNENLASHFVSFTATPIPRTLSLTLLDTLQPHFLQPIRAKQITTTVLPFENFDEKIVPAITSHLVKNRKVFLIVPKIEEDETDQLWNVSKLNTWAEKYFPQKVMQVHGKVKDKSAVLKEFASSNQFQILVSTTVIEVGVDIVEASLMVVFNSERFGLAALHQLRGRVGRNKYTDNQCILLTNNYSVNKPRLQFLTTSLDGYEIAEKDLQLRGSGDIIGKQQSGFLDEIEDVVGLDTSIYEDMKNFVDDLDWPDLKSLPRLKNYLEKTVQEIWQE